VGLAITGGIIYSGVQNGIERAVSFMMPMMFLLLLGLAAYNYFAGGFEEAVRWLFTPDFSEIGPKTVLAAIGQAFFSIGVAMGGMMTYGSYLPRSISITHSVFIIVIADTLVALVAGLVIFPAVFHNGLDPAAGAGLIFQTLPVAFAEMPGGYLFSILFFLMLSVAGITSMVGLVESVNSWLQGRFGISRQKSAVMLVSSIGILSVFSILSYNVMGELNLGGRNLNDLLDYFSNQILLPLGGLLIAVFAGWVVKKEFTRDELTSLKRYIVPPAVLIIFVMGIAG
jgi:NSS family neurotransmitter:Na+ symporter